LRKKSDDDARSSTILGTVGEQLVGIIRLQWIYSLKALIVLLLLTLNARQVDSQLCFSFEDLSLSNEDSSLSSRLKRRSLPQYHLIRETSVLLAEQLLQSDLNTPKDLKRTKTALIEIRSAILNSNLEEKIRDELAEHLFELKELIGKGEEESSILTASFQITVNRMHISVKFALNDLQQISEDDTQSIPGTK
jgi:hypothetical protein